MSKLLLLALLLLTSCSFVEKLESVGETAQEVGEIAGAILPPPWGTIIGGAITGAGGVMVAAAKIRSQLLSKNKILLEQKQVIETTLDSVINGVESGNKEVKKSIQNEARKRNVSDVLEKYVVKNKKT